MPLNDTFFRELSSQDFLETLPGVAYVLDEQGRLLAAGGGSWRRFAIENKTPDLADFATLAGRSIFEFIAGDDVAAHYHRMMDALRSASNQRFSFQYSCDSPATKRLMRMDIAPIRSQGRVKGFLYQSITLEQVMRAPVDLFSPHLRHNPDDPFLGICSYCLNVRFPAGSKTGEWMPAEMYYQRGGDSHVQLTHGICPACAERILPPIDSAYTEHKGD